MQLEANQHGLMEALSKCQSTLSCVSGSICTDMHQKNVMAMMVSLQRRLQTGADEDRERQFFTHTLQYLTTSSGRQVELDDWTITSYEVEFGQEIGSGGL